MQKQFVFNAKAFNHNFLPKPLSICLAVAVLLNLLAAQNGSWSLFSGVIIVAIFLLLTLGIYAQQRNFWKQAYIEFSDKQVLFYRKVKQGFESTAYEFEERYTTIYSVDEVLIKNKQVCIRGKIVVQIYRDQKHSYVEERQVKNLKIPMYFDNQEEIVRMFYSLTQ